MKHGTYILAFLMALVSLSESVYAEVPVFKVTNDTIQRVVIYFDKNKSAIDSCYMSNMQGIEALDSLLSGNSDKGYITALNVESFTSPEGDKFYNTCLAARRNDSVREFLQRNYPNVDVDMIHFSAWGEDWSGFRSLVAFDSNLPDREEVLILIDAHQDDIVKRKELLRKLNLGISYRYTVCNLFPKLRRSVITVTRELPEVDKKTFESVSSVSELSVLKQESKKREACKVVVVAEAEEPIESKTVLAVKNNMLYDLALAPNIEIEIPIGRRWSLNTEYKCPWWLNSKHNFCYQLLSGGVEGRCWLGKRRKHNPLTGHFVGLYAEGGIYDFQLHGDDGYQGKYYGAAGVTYGYAKQLARHFSLEFSLGIGYLTTEYKKYTPYEGAIVWTGSGRYNFIGPTKAKVSLVWLITTRR